MDDTHQPLDFCCRFRVDGAVVTVAPDHVDLLPLGVNLFDVVVTGDRERLLQAVTSLEAGGTPFDIRVQAGPGHVRVLHAVVEPTPDDVGDTDAAAPGTCTLRARDVTEARRLGALLHAHREVLDQIATGAPIATGLDAVARLFDVVSPAATVAIYLRHDDVLELAAAPSAASAFVQRAGRVEHQEGVPLAGTIEPLAGGLAAVVESAGLGFGWWRSVLGEDGDDVGRIVLLVPEKRFLTADERRALDEAARLVSVAAGTARAARRALDADARDPLTGLLHRRALLDVLGDEIGEHAMVVAMVRIGGLDRANAEHGLGAGDALLAATAERLRRVVRSRDLLARWSDARFVVLGRDRGGPDALDGFARRVVGGAGTRVVLGGRTIEPHLEVVVDRGQPGERLEALLLRLEARSSARGAVGPAIAAETGTTGGSGRGPSGR